MSGNPAASFNLVQYLKQNQLSEELQVASSGKGPLSAAQLNGKLAAEDAKSVELGVRSEWLNRTVRVNAAVFKSKYDNLQ